MVTITGSGHRARRWVVGSLVGVALFGARMALLGVALVLRRENKQES